MNSQDFAALAAQGYNRIPVSTEVLADLETPISVYRKLAEGPYSYFFESVQGGEKWGRYSIIGMACNTRLAVRGKRIRIKVGDEVVHDESSDDPLGFIEDYLAGFKVAEADHEVIPGLIIKRINNYISRTSTSGNNRA